MAVPTQLADGWRHLGLDEATALLGARQQGEVGRVQRERHGLVLPAEGSVRSAEGDAQAVRAAYGHRRASIAARRVKRA